MKKIVIILLLFVSCTVQRTSKFTTERVKPGMTKESVIALYGQPYKASYVTDSNHVLHESLYYKEHIFLKQWYEINNILHFENAVLTSIEQGEETPVDRDARITVK